MNLINLQKVGDFELGEYLEKNIPDLTAYQKQCLRDRDIIRFSPFFFMERREKTNSIWMRLSIVFILPVALMLIILLPFNFFITGSWGYDHEKLKWYSKWVSSCGL